MDSIFIRLQKVGPELLVEFKAHSGTATRKAREKLGAHVGLDFLGALRLIAANPADVGGNRDAFGIGGRRARLSGEQLFDALRPDPPLGDETICRQAGV